MKRPESFAWRRKEKGQRHNYCRPCHAAYHREHYLKNRQRYIQNAAALKRRERVRRTQFLLDFFRDNPCVDCGATDPVVLEFDHVGEKRFEIGTGFDEKRWQSILDEMKQCEVVCANCHRRRTAERRRSLRFLLSRGF